MHTILNFFSAFPSVPLIHQLDGCIFGHKSWISFTFVDNATHRGMLADHTIRPQRELQEALLGTLPILDAVVA